MKSEFIASAHAKCIIAGEHIVLRGMPAIVFPVIAKKITLTYKEKDHFKVKFLPSQQSNFFVPPDSILLECFTNALVYALKLIKITTTAEVMSGQFTLANNIPLGAGIGSSAALCVVIAKWLMWKKWLNQQNLFSFCHCLEDYFHGKSSGLDIAGAINDVAVHYEMDGNIHPIKPHWQPNLYLSYCGEPKNTKIAIEHLLDLRKSNPKLANLLDKEMQQSVLMVEDALTNTPSHGFSLLISALEHANHCFMEWDLISPRLDRHMQDLQELGAVAVKPTGSGQGGYVLSLWENAPPSNTDIEFIPLFTRS